jgi:hypothetical protein
MKVNSLITAFFALTLFLTACNKVDDPAGTSTGKLLSAITGDCTPVNVNGIFMVDSVLTDNNYVDVKIDVSVGGSFTIKSDSLNGYSFKKTGTVSTGVNTIRLYASGKPLATGTNTFTIIYGGTACNFSITVFGAGGGFGTALYTLGGSPGNCSVSSITGTYMAGQPMTAANKVEMTVNVTTPGTYIINGTSVNGVTFSSSGVFTNPGVQNIFLAATGTPTAAGSFNYPITNSTTNCGFSVTFSPGVPPAVFSLGGSPGNCTGVILNGTYRAGFPLTASNTAVVNVNVSSVGLFTISTTTVNGMQFSASGTFTSATPQAVTLTGTGTPITATLTNLPVTGGASTCNIAVPVNPAPVAAYTLDCTGLNVNGTYYVGSAVNASNTISLPVNVTAIGSYTITSTSSVNGITFSKTGTFTATGIQTVVIPGTGTPAVAGPFNYTLTGASGSCPFSVTAVTGTPGFYSCKIDGVYTEFTDRANGDIDDSGSPYLYLNGYTGPPTGGTVPQFQIFITNNNHAAVSAGTYNENAYLLPNGYRIEIDYTVENPDLSVTIWNTSSNILPPAHPPFTIIVTSITATRVIGTFSGKLTNTLQGSTMQKTITEGVFNLPIN